MAKTTTVAEGGCPFRAHIAVITLVVLLGVGYEQGDDSNDDLKGERHDDQRDDGHVESAIISST